MQDISQQEMTAPLRLAIIYIIITVFLSIAGPIKYYSGEYDKLSVVIYMFFVVLAIFFGFHFGLRIKTRDPVEYEMRTGKDKTYRFLKRAQLIAFISIIVELLYLISTGSIRLSFAQIGNAYVMSERSGSNPVFIFRFLTSFFRTASIGLGFFYFDEINKKDRVKTIILAILVVLIYVFGYGVQKGVADIFILLAVASYARVKRMRRVFAKKTIRIVILLGIVMLFLFSYMQYIRYELIGVTAYNYHLRSTGEYGFNTDHIIFKVFGDKLGFGLAHILGGYLSLGYYGLSLCLKLPFEWTYGIGSSYALTGLLELVGIRGIYEKTYLNRMQMEFGRHGLRTWNTIFPWLASDYTFIGAVFIMFVVGAVMAIAWREVLQHKNPISFLMLSLTMTIIIFIPANNQVLHGYDTFFTTIYIVIAWLFFRRRFTYE